LHPSQQTRDPGHLFLAAKETREGPGQIVRPLIECFKGREVSGEACIIQLEQLFRRGEILEPAQAEILQGATFGQIMSWRSTACFISAGWASHILVLPSMSVKRKLTVPLGILSIAAPLSLAIPDMIDNQTTRLHHHRHYNALPDRQTAGILGSRISTNRRTP
jgi:hypothetical protein